MNDPNRTCMSCMKELDRPEGVCPHCGYSNANCKNAAHQLPCGSILAGAYLIGRALGQGGFGITYIGFDLNLGTRVAIKEYYPEGNVTRDMNTRSTVMVLADDRRESFERGKEHFVHEARVLAKFAGQKGIVGVRSFFYENGTAYIVMDYIEGQTLKAYVAKRGGKLPSDEVLDRFKALFDPLCLVHAAGLLHRDISPDNIMLTKDDTLVLLDFGAARQMSNFGEHSNTINIKHGFAPEEQYRKRGEQGAWTDVYALCATIYRLITGVTPPDALDRLSSGETLPSPNSLGARLTTAQERALMRGLAVRANERTRTLEELKQELYGGIIVDPPRPPFDWKKYMPYLAAAIALVAVVILIASLPSKSFSSENGAAVTQAPGPELSTESLVKPTQEPTLEATQEPEIEATATPFQLTVSSVRSGMIAAGAENTLLLSSDGTVICLGSDDINTKGWKNIVQVAAFGHFAVGLKSDGTLVSSGAFKHGEGDVYDWRNVTQVDCGFYHTVAVTDDGRVYYTGLDKHNRSGSQNWTHVKRVLAGSDHLAAVLDDGTVVATGYSGGGRLETGSFTSIVSGDVGAGSTYGIRSDGSVMVTGENFVGEANVDMWTNIVSIAASDEHTVGLRSDGTVVATGSNEFGECDVEGWRDIVAIAAGYKFTIGVRKDGSVVATGNNSEGQIDVGGIKLW